jgi:hypothetical protein
LRSRLAFLSAADNHHLELPVFLFLPLPARHLAHQIAIPPIGVFSAFFVSFSVYLINFFCSSVGRSKASDTRANQLSVCPWGLSVSIQGLSPPIPRSTITVHANFPRLTAPTASRLPVSLLLFLLQHIEIFAFQRSGNAILTPISIG